jgi:hypothetical protein
VKGNLGYARTWGSLLTWEVTNMSNLLGPWQNRNSIFEASTLSKGLSLDKDQKIALYRGFPINNHYYE